MAFDDIETMQKFPAGCVVSLGKRIAERYQFIDVQPFIIGLSSV
jgi:hypothetical protein